MNAVLMQVVEEFAAFLEFGKADQLDPKFADWGRSRLRTLLVGLSADEKRELAAFLASEYEQSDGAYRTWIKDLPSQLGL